MPDDEQIRADVEAAFSEFRDMPALSLNAEHVGEILIRIVAMSMMLGHAEPQNTLCYVHPDDGTEGDFVCDVLSRTSNAELAEKWFSGSEGAARFAGWMSSCALGDTIRMMLEKPIVREYPKWDSPDLERETMSVILLKAYRDPNTEPWRMDVVRREAERLGIELA